MKLSKLTALYLPAILVMATLLRLYGLDWGIPNSAHPSYSYHPDEAFTLTWARWLVEGHAIPQHFVYGGTLHYSLLNSYWYFGKLGAGLFNTENPLAASILAGRYFLVLVALFSVVLVFECGRLLFNRATGLLAAGILAIVPAHVHWAKEVRPDEITALFVLFALYLGARVLKDDIVRPVRIAIHLGAFTGLALAFRFPLIVFGAMPVTAYLLRSQSVPGVRCSPVFVGRVVAIAVGVAIVTYACASPHSLVYFDQMLSGLHVTYRYESSVFLDAVDGGPLLYQHLFQMLPQALGWGVFVIAMAGIILAARRHSASDLVLFSGFVPYVTLLAWTSWVVVRYELPLLPLCALFASRIAVEWWRASSQPVARVVAATVVSAGLLWSFASALVLDRVEASENARDIAAKWILQNVPRTASVLTLRFYDSDVFFSPVLPPDRPVAVHVLGDSGDSGKLLEHLNFDYVVLAEPMYRNMERLGERLPHRNQRMFFQSLKDRGYVLTETIKVPMSIAGLDLSGSFTSLDYLVVNPGFRIYRSARLAGGS